LDPRLRIVVTFAAACTVLVLRNHAVLSAVVASLVVAGALTAQIGLRILGKRLIAVNLFSLMLIALVPWNAPGDALMRVGGFSYSVQGALDALRIALQANAVVLVVTLLLTPIDPIVLGHAVARLGAPARFVQLYLFTLRYLRVLDDEYKRLRRAMLIRGFRPRANLHTFRTLGYLVGMLLIRALDRAERIWHAMLCRGFSGRFPRAQASRLCWQDGLLFVAALSVLAIILGADRAVGRWS
jgi:cobalt/nickel transport system permease protein